MREKGDWIRNILEAERFLREKFEGFKSFKEAMRHLIDDPELSRVSEGYLEEMWDEIHHEAMTPPPFSFEPPLEPGEVPCIGVFDASPDAIYITSHDIPIGTNEVVRLDREHVWHIRMIPKRSGVDEVRRIIFNRPIIPLAKLDVDGMEKFTVSIAGEKEFTGDTTELLHRLKSLGLVVCQRRASDALSAVLSMEGIPQKVGHATVGIYPERDRWELCREPHPLNDRQSQQSESVLRPREPLTKESVQAYLDFVNLWDDYESLPVLGFGAISPFFYCIKNERIGTVPDLVMLGDPGLGKTELASAYTTKLYGTIDVSGSAMNSHFRYVEHTDSIGFPMEVSECEGVNWSDLIDEIKNASERVQLSTRGKPNLDMISYLARNPHIWTGNSLAVRQEATLTRLMIIHMNRSKKKQRIEKRDELEKAKGGLKRIGLPLLGFWLRRMNRQARDEGLTVGNWFRKDVSELEQAIDMAYIGDWEDPRRPRMWAFIHMGLMMWEDVARSFDLDWLAPCDVTFCEKVIQKIERTAFESGEILSRAFRDWLLGYIQKNTLRDEMGVLYVKGDGVYLQKGVVEGIDGYWITNTVIQDYRADAKRKELPVCASMADLARGVAGEFSLGDKGVVYKTQRFDKERFAVFVPIVDPPSQSTVDEF